MTHMHTCGIERKEGCNVYNIVAAIFEVESEGYQALTTLAKTPILNDTTVLQMALVKRDKIFLVSFFSP
jgi:hypothetical protein